MSIIVFYTFDYNAHNSIALTMLECSIITVKRELGPLAKIYVYTTNPSDLTNLSYLDIEIQKYNPADYGQLLAQHTTKNTFIGDAKNLEHFNVIGHSRLYIIKHLLKTEKMPVLYMDNDTGIVFSEGPNVIKLTTDSIYPTGYCLETWATIKQLTGINTIFQYKNITFNSNYNTVNNGLILYPYTNETIDFVDNTIGVYEMLLKIKHTVYNDMAAFSSVWHSTPGCKTFITDSNYYKTEKRPPQVIHYYFGKYKNTQLNTLLNRYVNLYKDNTLNNSFIIIPTRDLKQQYILNLFCKYTEEHFKAYPSLLDIK